MTQGVSRRPPWAVAAAVLSCLLIAGCTPQGRDSSRARARGGTKPTGIAADIARGSAAKPAPDKPGDLSDPCVARLHDLSGLLLLYYAVNKQLPERLDELAPLADVGTEFHADCPASGRPYAYVPHAVPAAGSDRFLVLYDAVPAHRGLRWGVFIAPPKSDQPPATWVILMSEEVFRQYAPQPAR